MLEVVAWVAREQEVTVAVAAFFYIFPPFLAVLQLAYLALDRKVKPEQELELKLVLFAILLALLPFSFFALIELANTFFLLQEHHDAERFLDFVHQVEADFDNSATFLAVFSSLHIFALLLIIAVIIAITNNLVVIFASLFIQLICLEQKGRL